MRARRETSLMPAVRAFIERHGLFVVVCLAAILPLFVVAYPPLQDFPMHVSTIRVLHDFHDPRFGFDQSFELTLGRTQYAGFYGFGHVLAYVAGPRGACLVLLAFYLAGTILALRTLLRVLGKDDRLALAVVPGLYGATFAIGLMPFLCAFPVTIVGVAMLVKAKLEPSPRRLAVVALVGVALFWVHVVHLGIFLFAAFVLFPFAAPNRVRLGALAALVPSGGAFLAWLTLTNVGRFVLELSRRWGSTNRPRLDGALLDMVPWTSDAYLDATDELAFGLLIAALALGAVLAFRTRTEEAIATKLYGLVPLALFLLFLTGQRKSGWVWPLGQRYMLPAFVFAIPLAAMPQPKREARITTIALLVAAFVTIANVTAHFVAFQREVGDFPAAIARMEPKKRVASLVYRSTSDTARFDPFLHFGHYYQAEKGGVVSFTLAGFDQWPIDFEKGRYPIYDGPATPQWPFFPAEVAEKQPLASGYDYVLARDRKNAPVPRGFVRTWAGDRWEVFERAPKENTD